MSGKQKKLSAEAAFSLFTNPHRRRLLVTLLDHDPEDWSTLPEDLTVDDEETGVMVAMAHAHLPKMETHGIVEWDRDAGAVRRGPAFEEIQPLLELVDEHRDELPDGWV